MKTSLKSYILLITMAICWSPSYLFIKVAIDSFPPFTLALIRVSLAAMIFIIIFSFQRQNLFPFLGKWKHFLFMGLTLNTLPFMLINYGEQKVTSSLAAILIAMTPIFTSILSHFFLDQERLKFKTLMGICLAIIGISIIYLPSFFEKAESTELGILMILGASICYAVGSIFARKYLKDLPLLIGPMFQMIMASLLLLPCSLIFDHPFSLPTPTFNALFSVIFLGCIGTCIAFFIYYQSIKISGATFTSLNSLLTPPLALILGFLILDEKLTIYSYIGATLILSGLVLANPYFYKKIPDLDSSKS